MLFLCPKCKSKCELTGCGKCGYTIPHIHSVFQFCDDLPCKLEGDDQYIGYDDIGEDFEPTVAYWDANNTERYGVYEACGDLIVQKFGKCITVLDLGAGLGTASIPLAKNGIYTIAADISNVMLSTVVKRAAGRYPNLVCARMNAYNLLLEGNSIDIVVENAMLHLVDHPKKVIREITRVLKPDGCLVRYGSYGQSLTEEEVKRNTFCNNVLNDLSDIYDKELEILGYKRFRFDNRFMEKILEYFKPPTNEPVEGFSEVFNDQLKFRLHRLRTGAHSDLIHVPKNAIGAAWNITDAYAKEKYGEAYRDIKGFSKYGAMIQLYNLKR